MKAAETHSRRVCPRRVSAGSEQGVTLIELLVVMALGLIVMAAVASIFMSSSRATTELQSRNDLIAELQIAQNYVAAQLREAVYVFPVGTTFIFNSGQTTRTPSGSSTWRVGDTTAPITAFIKPPERVGATCEAGNRQGCYAFYAYYPTLRSRWVAGVTGSNDPGDDPANRDRWVLVELLSYYNAPPTLPPSLPSFANLSGRLLLDYVQPAALAPAGAPALFTQQDASVPTQQTPGSVSVSLNFVVNREVRGRAQTIPGRDASTPPAETVRTVTVFPRNLGNLAP